MNTFLIINRHGTHTRTAHKGAIVIPQPRDIDLEFALEVEDYIAEKNGVPTWAEVEAELKAAGKCLQCYGDGYMADQTDTCSICHGTGKDMRGCEWCLVTHPVQLCPSIRTLLMRED